MRRRARDAARRVPASLATLLAVVLVLGVTWTLVVPPFQAPDEQSHFGCVQSLAAGPGLPGKATGHQPFSAEQLSSQNLSNSDQTASNLVAKPTWSVEVWKRWEREDASGALSRSDGGGPGNPAGSNPPLYYLYEAVPYELFSGGDFFSRVTAMRIASMLWLLVTVVGAWLLAGELFRRNRLLQLVSAGVAGLFPMVMFVSAQIGPDTMMFGLWSVAMWLGVRILRRGVTPATAISLLGLTGLAIVVKATSYALVPGALFAVAVGLWRIRERRPQILRTGAIALSALLVPVVGWFVAARVAGSPAAAQLSDASSQGSGTNIREFASYLWQYYLPRLPFLTRLNPTGGIPANQVFVRQGWGAFGWLEVRFPAWLYHWFSGLTAVVGVAAVTRLVVRRRRVEVSVAIFLLLVVLALLAGLHWTDYHQVKAGHPFMQARYLFPVTAVGGVVTALAISWFRGRGRAIAAGATLGGLFALQLASLALVAVRFYA